MTVAQEVAYWLGAEAHENSFTRRDRVLEQMEAVENRRKLNDLIVRLFHEKHDDDTGIDRSIWEPDAQLIRKLNGDTD